MKIFLIGFMGVGKTSTSRALAELTGVSEYDTDAMLVRREGMSIPEIFEKKGEKYFRDMETDLLDEFAEMTDAIISCGGGIILRDENIKKMQSQGEVIWLDATPETILKHVENDNNRPLLKGKKNIKDITEMMDARRPAYEKASQHMIRTDGLQSADVAKKILAIYETK